jgi:hypothetical protein
LGCATGRDDLSIHHHACCQPLPQQLQDPPVADPPLDHAQQLLVIDRPETVLDIRWAWYWAGDFPIPTDVTATTSVIPTASNSVYKRAVVIEVAG